MSFGTSYIILSRLNGCEGSKYSITINKVIEFD
jgi:hypothetical protein